MATDLKDAQVSVRLPAGLRDQLGHYAELTGRSKSHVAVEALSEYLQWRVPQTVDLKEAISAADAGDFADDAEVEATFERISGAAGKSRNSARPATRKPVVPRGK